MHTVTRIRDAGNVAISDGLFRQAAIQHFVQLVCTHKPASRIDGHSRQGESRSEAQGEEVFFHGVVFHKMQFDCDKINYETRGQAPCWMVALSYLGRIPHMKSIMPPRMKKIRGRLMLAPLEARHRHRMSP